MIQVGDLVRFREPRRFRNGPIIKGVWLVLKIAASHPEFAEDKALCVKGSRRIWAYYNEVEKL